MVLSLAVLDCPLVIPLSPVSARKAQERSARSPALGGVCSVSVHHRGDPALLPSTKGDSNTKARTAVPTNPASLIGRLKCRVNPPAINCDEQKLFWNICVAITAASAVSLWLRGHQDQACLRAPAACPCTPAIPPPA